MESGRGPLDLAPKVALAASGLKIQNARPLGEKAHLAGARGKGCLPGSDAGFEGVFDEADGVRVGRDRFGKTQQTPRFFSACWWWWRVRCLPVQRHGRRSSAVLLQHSQPRAGDGRRHGGMAGAAETAGQRRNQLRRAPEA